MVRNISLLYHFNHSSFILIVLSFPLETFSRSLESQVSLNQFFITVFPLDAILFFKLCLVLIHIAHEVYSKVSAEMEFTGNEIWNGTEVR